MGWIGHVEGNPGTPRDAYTFLAKTDTNMLGAGNLWVRRGMTTCLLFLKSALAQRKLNRRIPPDVVMNTMSKWPYPRECSKCSLAGGCSVYLKQAEIGPSLAFPYNPDLVYSNAHTGWSNLHWEKNYRNYRKIDSMEDCYDK